MRKDELRNEVKRLRALYNEANLNQARAEAQVEQLRAAIEQHKHCALAGYDGLFAALAEREIAEAFR